MSRSRRTLPRKLALLALGVVLALLALELVLQAVAYWTWRQSQQPRVDRGDGRVVLCVGDSFTFGLGTSAPARAYPARLQQLLRESDPTWQVFNCGWPGTNSRELLDKLPSQLNSYRPDVVLVLTGCNDFWRQAPAGEPVGGFRFELRTLRLARLIVHWLSTGRGPAESVELERPEFLGYWHAASTWLRFRGDQRIETESGEMHWTADGDELRLLFPATGAEFDVRWSIDGGRLTLDGGPWPRLVFEPGPPRRHALDRGRIAFDAGDFAEAERQFRAALELEALGLAAREALIATLVELDRRDDAERELATLEQAFEAAPSTALGDTIARSLVRLDETERAVELVVDMLAELPVGAGQVEFLIQHGLEVERRVELLRRLERAIARTDVEPKLRAAMLGAKAELSPEPGVAVRCLIEAQLLNPDEDLAHKLLLSDPERFNRTEFDRALGEADMTDEQRATLQRVYARAFALDDNTSTVLADHLRQIVQLCRAENARPILMVYPSRKPAIDRAVRAVAADREVEWIDIETPFRERLETVDRAELFVLDGHCNDSGYELMAELIADHLTK